MSELPPCPHLDQQRILNDAGQELEFLLCFDCGQMTVTV